MWSIFKYGVPVLGILGFGHSTYEVFARKIDAKKMGLTPEHLQMFGYLCLMQVVCWVLVIVGIRTGAAWTHPLAIFATGMYLFDYVVSLPSYKNLGDKVFKYWAGVAWLVQLAYILWAFSR